MSNLFEPVPPGGNWRLNAMVEDVSDHAIAMGFAELGQIGVASWVAGGVNDLLLLPIIYNYRHALELVLKAAIREAATRLRVGGDLDPDLVEAAVDRWLAGPKAGHDLQALADRLHNLVVIRLKLEGLPVETAQVLASLHALDPNGDSFRYATVRDRATKTFVAAPRPGTERVDVRAMGEQFDSAFNLLSGGLMSVLDEYRDYQAFLAEAGP